MRSNMETRLRNLALPTLVAGGCAIALAALGMLTPAFTDYELEAEPAVQALRAGDWVAFLEQAPAYGGSLVLRAPFAFLPELWGGGDHALFRSMAVPCLLAGVVLAVALWSRARKLGHAPLACWIALLLVAANPMTLKALEIGHPEELLGAVLCIAAALAAGRDRAVLAGVLLGLAIANKPWAVLAVVPVLALLGRGHVRLVAAAGAATGIVMIPLALAGGAVSEATAVAKTTGEIFQPWQIWWFLGDHGELVVGNFGEKPGYRAAPEWIGGIGHPIVVLIPAAVSLAFLPRVRRGAWHDGLLLLAFVLLLRCVLDPWNISYYAIPFLLALVTWELHAERRAPVVSLLATLLCWLTLVWLTTRASPDAQALAYLAWSVPLAGLLGARLLGVRLGPAGAVAPAAAASRPG
jgi:hypothetical protein